MERFRLSQLGCKYSTLFDGTISGKQARLQKFHISMCLMERLQVSKLARERSTSREVDGTLDGTMARKSLPWLA